MNENNYSSRVYAGGVHSVLQGKWTLRCATPLAVRNGLAVAYTDFSKSKARGREIRFKWREKTEESEFEVLGLHYGYEIINGEVQSFHQVPASSVRGALRSWTINHLVHPGFRRQIAPPPTIDEQPAKEYIKQITTALQDPANGYQLVASIFGQAFDTRAEAERYSQAGRLRIETSKFANPRANPIAANGRVTDGEAGPMNVNRQMTVRNPLDRMTHASKEGGLHHFLEFCAGETFEVRFVILNPRDEDLALVHLWVCDMNAGLLRVGALATIGRGRVSVADEEYTLWERPGKGLIQNRQHLEPAELNLEEDILAGLWHKFIISEETLSQFEDHLINYTRG